MKDKDEQADPTEPEFCDVKAFVVPPIKLFTVEKLRADAVLADQLTSEAVRRCLDPAIANLREAIRPIIEQAMKGGAPESEA